MSSFHYYLGMMYFVFLSCVSKRMTAERLNWQRRAEDVLKCRRFILPLKDVLCVPLLCLEEDDS
jgi:hypothetical protein